MKTCLYCGGNNKDSDTICLLCKRDLKTGDGQRRETNSLHPFTSVPLPQPESPYISLLLLLPALVLFLLGLAVYNAASQTLFFGVHLPVFVHYEAVGNLMFFGALVFVGIGAWRMVRLFAVMKGYYLVLRSEMSDESQRSVRNYARYQKAACGFYPFLWLLPIAALVGMCQLLYVSSYARSAVLLDTFRFYLPKVKEPIPYIFLLLIAILGLAIQFAASLRTMIAHRRYRRECKRLEQGVGAIEAFSRLNPRLFPAPLSANLGLLILPAVLALAFFGVFFLAGEAVDSLTSVASSLWGLVMLAGAVVLTVILVKRYRQHREAGRDYWVAIGAANNKASTDAKNVSVEAFNRYQANACQFRCFLWLIPIVFFLLFGLYVVVSNSVYSVVLPGGMRVILPYFHEPVPYILLSLAALISLAILFAVSLYHTLNYRRCANVARAQYREELAEAQARAQAEAEKEDADEADSLQSDSFFTNTDASDETVVETEPDVVEATPDQPDDISLWMSAGETVAAPVEGVDDRRLAALLAMSSKKVETALSARQASSWQELYEWFTRFAEAQGFKPEPSSVRALLAAMATGRVLYLRAQDEASQAFASTLARFFGENTTAGNVTSAWDTPQALLCNKEEHVWTDSDCLKGMYYARKTPDAFCTLTLTNGDAADGNVYLADLLAYDEVPTRANSLCLMREIKTDLPEGVSYRTAAKGRPGGIYMDMPRNIWCIVLPSEEGASYGAEAGAEAGMALTVSLRGVACEPVAVEATDEGALSVSAFLSLLRGLMDDYFLPEEQWKKFDRVEDFLSARTGVRFGNCLARRLETFSSVYMAMEEDVDRVLDAMLEVMFLPLIGAADASCLGADDGGTGIYEVVSQAFGGDTIPNSMRALRSMGYGA